MEIGTRAANSTTLWSRIGHSSFKAHTHAGPIDLDKNIVRKVSGQVEEHHSLRDISQARPLRRLGQNGRCFRRIQHDFCRGLPVRHQVTVKLLGIPNRHYFRQPVHSLANRRRTCQPGEQRTEPTDQAVIGGGLTHSDESGQGLSGEVWKPSDRLPELARIDIALVPSEQLIATISGEAHGNVPARQGGNQVSWNLGGVRERLVVKSRQLGDDIQGFFRGHVQFGVFGPEVGGHSLGMSCLIEFLRVKADGERLHRAIALRLHQCDHRRRIDAAGKEGAQRDIRYHPQANRFPQEPIQLLDSFTFRAPEWVRGSVLVNLFGQTNRGPFPTSQRRSALLP